MSGLFRFTIRELLLLIVIVALFAVMVRDAWVDEKPVYLHVYGTYVQPGHDLRLSDAPRNYEGRPWTRIATIEIYDRCPFAFFTPNDRSPAIDIGGKLQRSANRYQGTVSFFLDDNSMTYSRQAKVNLPLEKLAFIDNDYYCYVLSAAKDPYPTLRKAMDAHDKESAKNSAKN